MPTYKITEVSESGSSLGKQYNKPRISSRVVSVL